MIIACLKCRAAIRILGDDAQTRLLVGTQSDYWPDNFPCYRCGGKAEGFLEPEVAADALLTLEILDLTADEAFAALNGLGVPEEQNCCAEVIEELFQEHGIKVAGRQQRGVTRYYVDYLELKDGRKVYLGPSPQGVAVYRITKPFSYAQNVLQEVTNESG
jgi:hypothetical protein